MKRLLEMSAGFLLKRLLGRPQRPLPSTAGSGAARRRGSARVAPARPAAAEVRPRGPLLPLVLGSFAVGAVLMLIFDVWYTRLVGVLALFTFVVAGVFLITGSGLLDPEDGDEWRGRADG